MTRVTKKEATAVLWHFLSNVAGKLGRPLREDLATGQIYEVENIQLQATVGQTNLGMALNGSLSVGADAPGATRADPPNTIDLVALMFGTLSERVRKLLFCALPQDRATFLAEVEAMKAEAPKRFEEAEALLRSLTAQRPNPKRGAVTCKFEEQ